jgi:hypothetical protein
MLFLLSRSFEPTPDRISLSAFFQINERTSRMNQKITQNDAKSPSNLISRHIEELGDWRGKLLAQLRKLILDAAPDLTEGWKWGTAVWVSRGNVVAAGAFKDHVKLNFFKGASLNDPSGLFNAGFEAKATRAIDFHEGDKINAAALKELIRTAVALNGSDGKKKRK